MKIIRFRYRQCQTIHRHYNSLIYTVFITTQHITVRRKEKHGRENQCVFFFSLEATFSRDRHVEAEKELRADADTHYHTVIGRATIYEIIATALVFVITAVTFWFGTVATRETA